MTVDGFRCRSCASPGPVPILSLGRTPLANALLTNEQLGRPEPEYPLDLVLCPDCSLVQIVETVPPEILFGDYPYFSSFSETALSNARGIAERLIASRRLGAASLAAEIASNDGYLLQYYRSAGIPVLGIEPARNIAAVAEARGIPTRAEFFGRELALRLQDSGEQADVLHLNNVLAHVPDLNGVVEGIRLFLKPEGLAVVEVPYVKDLLDRVEFDTIYHEHLCYFSLTALEALVRRHGLAVTEVERIPIHGGSLRVFLESADVAAPSASVRRLLDEEAEWGVRSLDFYRAFSVRVAQVGADLRLLLSRLKAEGKRLAAYGASAKGSTLLNTTGIGSETIDYIVDRSTVKQGKYTPGTHLQIHAPEKLLIDKPDYVLLLTWNFADEILAQQAEYRRRGGRFIIPIPEPRVI